MVEKTVFSTAAKCGSVFNFYFDTNDS